MKRGGLMTPVNGKVYITEHIAYAGIYALGANMIGSEINWNLGENIYGYIFKIDGSDITDVQPDEDSIGEVVSVALFNSPYSKEAIRIFNNLNKNQQETFKSLASSNLTSNQKAKINLGEYAYFALSGKKLVKLMSDSLKLALIVAGCHIANSGALYPFGYYRFLKTDSPKLKKDCSNIDEVAEYVSLDNNLKESVEGKSNLMKWFGNSKVVAADGQPLVVYHGSDEKFDTFDTEPQGKNHWQSNSEAHGGGFFFADKKRYVKMHKEVYPVYLKMENPLVEFASDYYYAVDKFDSNSAMYLREAKLNGHDGIIMSSPTGSMYVVFEPNQIKSISAKSFDSSSATIYESESDIKKETFSYERNTEREVEQGGDRKSYNVNYNNELAGYIDFINGDIMPTGNWEIYIEVLPEYKGRGFSKYFYWYLPANIRPKIFYAVIHDSNVISNNLHKKLGFKKLKDIKFKDELYYIYEITGIDYDRFKQELNESVAKSTKSVIAYHGSNSVFSDFELPSSLGSNDVLYFSSSKQIARQYGENIYKCKITFNSSLVLDLEGESFHSERGFYLFKDAISDAKYYDNDVVIFNNAIDSKKNSNSKIVSTVYAVLNPSSVDIFEITGEKTNTISESVLGDAGDSGSYQNDSGAKFWGTQGAGVLPVCKSTGRFLIGLRSGEVNAPNEWGMWGAR